MEAQEADLLQWLGCQTHFLALGIFSHDFLSLSHIILLTLSPKKKNHIILLVDLFFFFFFFLYLNLFHRNEKRNQSNYNDGKELKF